ncbi:esterase family protein [Nocardia sp. 2]|uniref:Acyl-CoA:diacylglycerol acyltransferase n=1 Tax=Nocardia acididurans TaxID=2802282 RepID=A0ABS1LY78_9NOCA|nr:alpha/beta hydrolase family protein [Nocardia acididurans]MBL1073353.1 esterase family protein [Nocardia acididurans]
MRVETVGGAQPERALGRRQLLKSAAVGVAAAAVGVSVAGRTSAAFNPAGFDFWVDSTMGPIKNRIFRAADGNTNRVVYALDGQRARDDLNGWEIDTNVAAELMKANINVVMPVGGQSSWYADWDSPSTFLGIPAGSAAGSSGSGGSQVLSGGPGKSYAYKWETYLTTNLRDALRDRLGFTVTRNGVFGLSMSGGSALMLAAFYPGQFCYAGSFSGALNLSLPFMKDAVRASMIDAGGYNIDALASAKSTKWQHLDPYMFAPKLKANNTRLWISSGSALPSSTDGMSVTTIQGMGIEAVSLVGTRSFQSRFSSLGGTNVTYDYPAVGIHNWKNWEAQLYKMLPDLSANIG